MLLIDRINDILKLVSILNDGIASGQRGLDIDNIQEWNDILEEQLKKGDPNVTVFIFENDRNRSPSKGGSEEKEALRDKVKQVCTILKKAILFFSSKTETISVLDARLFAELLRTSKNIIQIYHHYTQKILYARASMSISSDLKDLKCHDSIQLYMKHIMIVSKAMEEERIILYSLVCLFHCTFGSDDSLSRRARELFMSSQGTVLPLKAILQLYTMTTTQSKIDQGQKQSSHMLLLVLNRFLHNLFGRCNSDGIPSFDSLKNKCDDILLQIAEEDNDNSSSTATESDIETLIVNTLTWCVHSSSTPDEKEEDDKRPQIACEILHILFIFQHYNLDKYNQNTSDNTASMDGEQKKQLLLHKNLTQMGILICDILHMKTQEDGNENTQQAAVWYKVKLASVQLLMNAPPNYSSYFNSRGTIDPLLVILKKQLLPQQTQQGNQNKTKPTAVVAYTMVPILQVLNKLCSEHPLIFQKVHDFVFPPGTLSHEFQSFSSLEEEKSNSNKIDKMKPLDAPPNTIRYLLINLMTSFDTNIKRYSGELLWNLSHKNTEFFVQRTGVGNSIWMLGVKGMVNLPS